jgi:hypothetical protein
MKDGPTAVGAPKHQDVEFVGRCWREHVSHLIKQKNSKDGRVDTPAHLEVCDLNVLWNVSVELGLVSERESSMKHPRVPRP